MEFKSYSMKERIRVRTKGQYITLENMLFFAIGIAMIVTIYAVFSNISDSIRSSALDEQLAKEGDSARAVIAKVFAAGNSTNSTIRFSLDIPERLSECEYKIVAKENMLRISCTDNPKTKTLNLYGIETKIENDAVYSSSGRINIFYSGGKILLS